jgi:hypothetical protein
VSIAEHDEVVATVGVSMLAMGLLCITSAHPHAAQYILTVRHHFEVGGVDTGTIAAEVIDIRSTARHDVAVFNGIS